MNVERISRRRRQKKRWLDVVRSDIRSVGVYVDNVRDRVEWMFRTRVADRK